jgi:hypothetical protein
MDDPHQVVQQLALLTRANMTHGGFIQQAFHAPKQPRRPMQGNEFRVKPAHVYPMREVSTIVAFKREEQLTFFERFEPFRTKHIAEPTRNLSVVARARTHVSQLVLSKPFTGTSRTLTLPHALLHLAFTLLRQRQSVAILAAIYLSSASANTSNGTGTGTIDATRRPFTHANLGWCPGEPKPKLDLTLLPPARASANGTSAPHR